MSPLRSRRFLGAAAFAGAALWVAWLAAAAPPAYDDIERIFQERCVVCHSGDDAPKGLRLDRYEHLLQGSVSGPVVLAGDPAGSELVRRIRGSTQPRMPLTGPPFLSDEQIASIESWIAAGLPVPLEGVGQGEETTVGPEEEPRPPDAPLIYGDVAPILLKRCVKCHIDGGLRGPAPEGLRLDRWESLLAGGERRVVVPGSPGASELVRRIRGLARPRMPLDGPPYLSPEHIELISRWVQQGARDEAGNPAPLPTGARVRLHGTLSALWELDGYAFRVDRRTRVKKRATVGDYVEVRGIVGADGSIRAIRIRPR